LSGLCSSGTCDFFWKVPTQVTSNASPWNERLHWQLLCKYTRRILCAGHVSEQKFCGQWTGLRLVGLGLSPPTAWTLVDGCRYHAGVTPSHHSHRYSMLKNAREVPSPVLGHAGIPLVHASRKTTCPSRLKAGRSMPL